VTAPLREWDAASYQRVSVPHEEWAKAVLEPLTLPYVRLNISRPAPPEGGR
jgi:hypothetical protein